jgi:hypothetical protein
MRGLAHHAAGALRAWSIRLQGHLLPPNHGSGVLTLWILMFGCGAECGQAAAGVLEVSPVGLGDVGPAAEFQDADGEVTEGGHDGGAGAGADLAGARAVGGIAYVVEGLAGPGEVFQLGVDVGAYRASRQAPDPGRTRRPSRVHYAVAMTRKRNVICFQLFRQIGILFANYDTLTISHVSLCPSPVK